MGVMGAIWWGTRGKIKKKKAMPKSSQLQKKTKYKVVKKQWRSWEISRGGARISKSQEIHPNEKVFHINCRTRKFILYQCQQKLSFMT